MKNDLIRPEHVLLDPDALVPEAWRVQTAGPFRVFNPTILAHAEGYTLCYRVVPVSDDGADDPRRIATCRLTRSFQVVAGSVVPLSDLVRFTDPDGLDRRALEWHADPRYYRLRDRVYLYWNDGSNRPKNNQFLMEMDAAGLAPAGPARALELEGMERRDIEKNWSFFEASDDRAVFAVYSVSPHVVLACDLDDPRRVVCRPFSTAEWDNPYEAVFGMMRGGAAPFALGEAILNPVHSSYKVPEGRVYQLCFYGFEARPPFRPVFCAAVPTDLPFHEERAFQLPKLNRGVHRVAYPSGVVLEPGQLVVAYGINDEACAIAVLPLAEIEAALAPVASGLAWVTQPATVLRPPTFEPPPRSIPLFWWDAAGKKFDGAAGGRRIFAAGNFGDIASREIVERIIGGAVHAPGKGERKLLAVGSVLHTAGNGDIIWGTGIKGTARKLEPGVKELSIHAVRGPLTLDFLREKGFDVSRVTEVFDPGCLVPQLYARELAAHDPERNRRHGTIRIVPHYRDDLYMRRLYWRHSNAFLSVDCTPAEMACRMLGAEAVFSSSLHGVIFAESLGIPAYWLRSIGGEDGYKFYDYYYGTGRYGVVCHDSLEAAMAARPMPLPTFRPEAYLATFPHEALAELGGAGPGLRLQPTLSNRDTFEQFLAFDPESGRPGDAGFWFNVPSADLWLDAGRAAVGADLRITVVPQNPHQLPTPQAVRISAGDVASAFVEWPRGDERPVTVSFRVTPEMRRKGRIRLAFDARHATSKAEIGAGRRAERLSIAVAEIELVPEGPQPRPR